MLYEEFLNFLWPRKMIREALEFDLKAKKLKNEVSDSESIEKELLELTNWGLETVTALNETYRIVKDEDKRLLNIETKSSAILAIIFAAFFPALYYVNYITKAQAMELIWEWKITVAILILTVFYATCTFYWAYKTVKTEGYRRISAEDLRLIWQENPKTIQKEIISTILLDTIVNRSTVQAKENANRLAQSFFVNVVTTFSLAVFGVPVAFYLINLVRFFFTIPLCLLGLS